jgi:hypothetical protein
MSRQSEAERDVRCIRGHWTHPIGEECKRSLTGGKPPVKLINLGRNREDGVGFRR